jgi:hypothetical protein
MVVAHCATPQNAKIVIIIAVALQAFSDIIIDNTISGGPSMNRQALTPWLEHSGNYAPSFFSFHFEAN